MNRDTLINFDVGKAMSGKNPHVEEDGVVTYDEQWTTHSICRISQVYLEPVLKVCALMLFLSF